MSEMQNFKPKSFWKRPEGTTGMIFLIALLAGGGFLLFKALPFLIAATANILQLAVMLVALAAIVYMVLDPKMRNLVWYMYKSVMRKITGVFVQIDPIGILESYVDDLKDNLRKMSKQIGSLRGQMRRLKTMMDENSKNIKTNLNMANKAKATDKQAMMVLKARKAGRLKESNMKLGDLYKKMEVLHRVLKKMYENSEILLEDVKDQVELKKAERKAIRASHSAMKSAMNVISGDKDKRAMFDQALEVIADDVAQKVGEMEQFMDLSANFMDSIDLQNGVFEEEGMQMLEKWEKESTSILLGKEKSSLLLQAADEKDVLDLDQPIELPAEQKVNRDNQYSNLFDD